MERADLLAVQNHPGLAMNLTTVRNRRARFSGALLIGSALILLAGATNSVAQVSLQTAIQRAAQVDPNITALRQQITSREIGIQEARDAYYPSLSIGADTNTTDANGPGLTVTISQVIYDWGLTRSNIATASQSRVQAVSDLKIALEGLTLRVAEAFLDVEIAEMKLRLTEDYRAPRFFLVLRCSGLVRRPEGCGKRLAGVFGSVVGGHSVRPWRAAASLA